MVADWLKVMPVETPGHLSDHNCYQLIESIGGKQFKSIFTGDHIIGGDSTFFEDYPEYFKSLLKTKKIVMENQIETLYPAHSVSLYKHDICLPALAKVDDYITRRVKKDRKLEKIAEKLQVFTLEEFFDAQTAKKQAKSDDAKYDKISKSDRLRGYMLEILKKQLMKLIVDGKYRIEKNKETGLE